jgi:hypothetical protein
VTQPSTADAAQRAYGILWREPGPSIFARDARRQLLEALTPEERRAGACWAMDKYRPPSTGEMIAADNAVVDATENERLRAALGSAKIALMNRANKLDPDWEKLASAAEQDVDAVLGIGQK